MKRYEQFFRLILSSRIIFQCFLQAEQAQTEACEKFEQMSEKGKEGTTESDCSKHIVY